MAGRRGGFALLAAAVLLVGCSGSGTDDNSQAVPVFEIGPGMCFNPPQDITKEISELGRVDCATPHLREAYALVPYRNPDGNQPSDYPGDSALTTFAAGACAEAFADYVGISYQDSSLLYDSLVPSARGWQQGNDRNILCYIVASTAPLTSSVADSRL